MNKINTLLPGLLWLWLAQPVWADDALHCQAKPGDDDIQVLECDYARDDLAGAYRAFFRMLRPQGSPLPAELPPQSRVYPDDAEVYRYIKWEPPIQVVVVEEGRDGSRNTATLRREQGRVYVHWLALPP